MDIREVIENTGKTEGGKLDGHVDRLELILKQGEENRDDEIDLSEMILKVFRGKGIIFFSVVLALVISVVVFLAKYVIMSDSIGTVSTVVNFNFDGIDKGLDPHGNTFDVSEIKKAEVITKALEENDLDSKGMTVEDVRRNIYISGVVPKDIMDRILVINKMAEKDASKLEMLNDIEYFAVQYKVDFNVEKSLGISKEEALQLLSSIIHEYREYFLDKYSDKYVLSGAVSELDTSRYDFSEVVMLAEEQISTMRNYVSKKNTEAPDFRAQNTGLSFSDILSRIDIVSNVDLNRAQSLIYTFNLSKDPVKLAAIYQNRVTNMEKQVEKKTGEAANTRQVIQNYQKDTSIMMMTGDSGAPVEMTSGSAVYDDLVKQANEAENEAVRLKSEIEYYKSLITKLTEEDTIDKATKNKYSKEVQEELTSLLERLQTITVLTNDTVDNYFETDVYSTAVKTAIEPVFTGNFRENLKSGVLMAAVLVVIAIMLSTLFVLARDMFRTGKSHAQSNS